jgi:hypothetical protein
MATLPVRLVVMAFFLSHVLAAAEPMEMETPPRHQVAKKSGKAAAAKRQEKPGGATKKADPVGGARPEEDLGMRPKSTRRAAKANTAIFDADSSSGVSPTKKKTKPTPPSPQHAVVPKGPGKAKAGPVAPKSKAKAAPKANKRPKDDDDFVVAGEDVDDVVEDGDDDEVAADEDTPPVPALKAAPIKMAGPKKVLVKNVVAAAPAALAAGAAVAAAPADDADEMFRLVRIEREAHRCTCALVAKLTVKDLKAICNKLDPRVNFRERVGNATKDMRKKRILVELCCVCTSEEAVTAAIAAAGYVQGVAPKFWHPRVQFGELSLLTAFHHAMMLAAAEPENAAFSIVLNEFRAHFAKMLTTNFRFYVVDGKINKADEVGQDFVIARLERFAHYVQSIKSALNHYRGIHSDMTCGRLRKGLVCTPFRIFRDCDPRVEQILKAKVEVFLLLLMEDEALMDISAAYHDQAKLNARFGFYSHCLRNASTTRCCQLGKLLKERNAKYTRIFQCTVDIASPFRQKNRKCA